MSIAMLNSLLRSLSFRSYDRRGRSFDHNSWEDGPADASVRKDASSVTVRYIRNLSDAEAEAVGREALAALKADGFLNAIPLLDDDHTTWGHRLTKTEAPVAVAMSDLLA